MTTLLRTIQEAVAIEDEVLTDIGLRETSVYLRTKTASGADELTGEKGTETIKDEKFPANPKVKRAGLKMISLSNGYVEAGDLLIIIPAHWFTSDALFAAEGIVWNDNLWKVINVEGEPEDSTPIKFKILIRKMSIA